MVDIVGYLADAGLQEVGYKEFYRDLFPVGSFEERGKYEEGKYNGIMCEVPDDDDDDDGTEDENEKNEKKFKVFRHTVTDDLEKLDEVLNGDNFCLMSPISYAGKSRKSENARFLYAIAVDLDGIESDACMDCLFRQIDNRDYFAKNGVFWGIPEPTYLVASGTGLHLYFVFEDPIPLFRSIVRPLEKYKKRLTWQIWSQGASSLHDNIQYESLFQGFRMVGSITKIGTRVRAFKLGSKTTLEEVCKYVPPEYRVASLKYKSKMTLAAAAKKYPEWYERRIVQEQPRGAWTCKPDLFYWWLNRLHEVTEGHRYWAIFTLAVYARKSGIDYDILAKHAFAEKKFLNDIGEKPFKNSDIVHALEAYNDSYMTYPIDAIVERTNIPITKNPRNGLKQKQHLYLARRRKEDMKVIGIPMKAPEGRPDKAEIVRNWQQSHPDGRKADCIRDTGLSKPTVYKWWK